MSTFPTPAPWLKDAVFYQIFPERFRNGDPTLDPPGTQPWDSAPTRENFLGGDLRGIIDGLDHVLEVGANAIYFTPIFRATTNHRYDTVDYFSIDPTLGTLDDFDELVRACHDRGIKVVLDAVLNHCGIEHPAFVDVMAKGWDSPHVNWYSIDSFPITPSTPNYKNCSGCWYMPKWNVFNREVRDHHLAVARYWLERGIDGWRLDVPYYVPMGFWREFRELVKSEFPNACIIAEEWRSPVQWLQGDTADSAMNYTLRDLILGFTADRKLDAIDFAAGITRLDASIPEVFKDGMFNLIGSHDTERVLTRHNDDVTAALAAYTLLMTSRGTPMVYYGDEVGMRGDNDPGCRAGMVWDKQQWNSDILRTISTLAQLRQDSVALREGHDEVSAVGLDTVLRVRRRGEHVVVVAVNRGPEPVDIDLWWTDDRFTTILGEGHGRKWRVEPGATMIGWTR